MSGPINSSFSSNSPNELPDATTSNKNTHLNIKVNDAIGKIFTKTEKLITSDVEKQGKFIEFFEEFSNEINSLINGIEGKVVDQINILIGKHFKINKKISKFISKQNTETSNPNKILKEAKEKLNDLINKELNKKSITAKSFMRIESSNIQNTIVQIEKFIETKITEKIELINDLINEIFPEDQLDNDLKGWVDILKSEVNDLTETLQNQLNHENVVDIVKNQFIVRIDDSGNNVNLKKTDTIFISIKTAFQNIINDILALFLSLYAKLLTSSTAAKIKIPTSLPQNEIFELAKDIVTTEAKNILEKLKKSPLANPKILSKFRETDIADKLFNKVIFKHKKEITRHAANDLKIRWEVFKALLPLETAIENPQNPSATTDLLSPITQLMDIDAVDMPLDALKNIEITDENKVFMIRLWGKLLQDLYMNGGLYELSLFQKPEIIAQKLNYAEKYLSFKTAIPKELKEAIYQQHKIEINSNENDIRDFIIANIDKSSESEIIDNDSRWDIYKQTLIPLMDRYINVIIEKNKDIFGLMPYLSQNLHPYLVNVSKILRDIIKPLVSADEHANLTDETIEHDLLSRLKINAINAFSVSKEAWHELQGSQLAEQLIRLSSPQTRMIRLPEGEEYIVASSQNDVKNSIKHLELKIAEIEKKVVKYSMRPIKREEKEKELKELYIKKELLLTVLNDWENRKMIANEEVLFQPVRYMDITQLSVDELENLSAYFSNNTKEQLLELFSKFKNISLMKDDSIFELDEVKESFKEFSTEHYNSLEKLSNEAKALIDNRNNILLDSEIDLEMDEQIIDLEIKINLLKEEYAETINEYMKIFSSGIMVKKIEPLLKEREVTIQFQSGDTRIYDIGVMNKEFMQKLRMYKTNLDNISDDVFYQQHQKFLINLPDQEQPIWIFDITKEQIDSLSERIEELKTSQEEITSFDEMKIVNDEIDSLKYLLNKIIATKEHRLLSTTFDTESLLTPNEKKLFAPQPLKLEIDASIDIQRLRSMAVFPENIPQVLDILKDIATQLLEKGKLTDSIDLLSQNELDLAVPYAKKYLEILTLISEFKEISDDRKTELIDSLNEIQSEITIEDLTNISNRSVHGLVTNDINFSDLSTEELKNLRIISHCLENLKGNKNFVLNSDQKKGLCDFFEYASGNKTLNKLLSKHIQSNHIADGISTATLKFLRAFTFKSKLLSQFQATTDKLVNAWQKISEGLPLQPNEKITISEFGILEQLIKSSKMFEKIKSMGLTSGDIKINDPLSSNIENLDKLRTIAVDITSKIQSAIGEEQNYSTGDIYLPIIDDELAFRGAKANLGTSFQRNLITRYQHEGKLFVSNEVSNKVFISEIMGKWLFDELRFKQLTYSDVYRILPVKLLSRESIPIFQEMYGDHYEEEINKLFQGIETEVHHEEKFTKKFQGLANDKKRRIDAGKAKYMVADRYKKAPRPFQKLHEKFFNEDISLGQKMICSEFTTKTTVVGLIELQIRLKEKVVEHLMQNGQVELAEKYKNDEKKLLDLPITERMKLSRFYPGKLIKVLSTKNAVVKIPRPKILQDIMK